MILLALAGMAVALGCADGNGNPNRADGGVMDTGGNADANADADTDTDTGASCPFPTSFQWTDYGGPFAEPKNGWVSLKDFTNVVFDGQHIVYSTYNDGTNYGSQMVDERRQSRGSGSRESRRDLHRGPMQPATALSGARSIRGTKL
jgi:hypothetical protein